MGRLLDPYNLKLRKHRTVQDLLVLLAREGRADELSNVALRDWWLTKRPLKFGVFFSRAYALNFVSIHSQKMCLQIPTQKCRHLTVSI